ncbi:MAG: glycogen synthase, partial [Candidatus Omnitrophica bacterium]|nr:glycogen synthase [Candidatus Omnitrophota bacterium]
LYGTAEGDYQDNAYRFSFFSKAVLAAAKAVGFGCDIIHCNDWQSALAPFYLKFKLNKDKFYKRVKALFTIHNLAYQGQFPKDVMKDIDIPDKFFNMYDLEFYRKINFMKSGILYSNAVNTVSKGYAREILTPEYGCGLDGVLMTRSSELFGITNGADYSEWDPQIDSHIKERYNSNTIEKKMDCKTGLLRDVNMNLSPDRPLLGVITRLARQKGIDLLADIMERLIDLDIGVILLGKGDEEYQNLFLRLSGEYPEHLSVNIKFDNELAHKIEAGSDMFLMPSRYEPCGLNQIYSLRYGTIPVVRATGGLDDIIVDFDEDRIKGNGFKFGPAAPDAFCKAIERALRVFEDKTLWASLVERVMKLDFSWEHSAKEYIELYEKIIKSGG